MRRMIQKKQEDPTFSDKDLIQFCNALALATNVTALHRCAESGQAEICEYLLRLSVPDDSGGKKRIIEANWSLRTALFEASCFGHLQVAQLLLDAGADINRKDDRHWTPLHVAARHGRNGMIRLLLDRGANKELTSDLIDYIRKNGRTAREVARLWGHYDTEVLLK